APAARRGLDRTEHVDPAENGNWGRKFRPEHIQDRQSAGISKRDRWRAVHAQSDRRFKKRERPKFAAASRRRHDRKHGLPVRGEGKRSVALSRSGKTDPGFARLRFTLLLPARPANDDPDLPRRVGEKVRPQSLNPAGL